MSIQAEREVIKRMARLPGEWHAIELSNRPELTQAAEYLLSIGLVRVRWGVDMGTWEYKLTEAGKRIARYMSGVSQYVLTVRAGGEDVTLCVEATDEWQAGVTAGAALAKAGYAGSLVLRVTEPEPVLEDGDYSEGDYLAAKIIRDATGD